MTVLGDPTEYTARTQDNDVSNRDCFKSFTAEEGLNTTTYCVESENYAGTGGSRARSNQNRSTVSTSEENAAISSGFVR